MSKKKISVFVPLTILSCADYETLLTSLDNNLSNFTNRLSQKIQKKEYKFPNWELKIISDNPFCVPEGYTQTTLVIDLSDPPESEEDKILITSFDLAFEMVNTRLLYNTSDRDNSTIRTSYLPNDKVPWIDTSDIMVDLFGTVDPDFVYPYRASLPDFSTTTEILIYGLTQTQYLTGVFIIVIIVLLLFIGFIYVFGSPKKGQETLFTTTKRSLSSYVQ